MCANYTEFQIGTYFSLLVQVTFYFGTALPGFFFQFFDCMQGRKVQMNKAHTMSEQWKCLKQVLFAKSCIYLPLIMLLFTVVKFVGIGVAYDYASIPAWYSILPRMYFCLWCEDTWHYWAHRALHDKRIYGQIHKIHHTFNIPFGLAAEYAHPIETVVLGVGFFIPLLLPWVHGHLFIFWCWLATRMLQTIDVHSGFYFPYLNPLYLLPLYGGVRFHDFHHSFFNANYASTFTFWDWACGTDSPYWEREEDRIKAEEQGKLGKALKSN